MADGTRIEWTDATWNPITGCSVVSPGCTNCYAMRLAGTRLQHHPSRAGLTVHSAAGPVWNGQVRLNEQWLDQPLRWKRGRRIFVCAHGDLFHENVPDCWIDQVFAVMALAPQHTFQVLTKRADRMRSYMETLDWLCDGEDGILPIVIPVAERFDVSMKSMPDIWPFPHIWHGVSVEDQHRADTRVPHLLATPASVRFLSVEPMLAPIRALPYLMPVRMWSNGDLNNYPYFYPKKPVDWVICGGESGPNARDMNPDWARSLRDQCAAADVPFFMKQMARKAPIPADLMVRQWPDQTK
ncbi:MAG TPA: phage Gp37/Gp68 family protein [Acidocella sp.]|nr:phage Gp37/Gp68 family protein [Acidocella sp.]